VKLGAADDIDSKQLRAIHLDLIRRRYMLSGDFEKARIELRNAEPSLTLTERGLAGRLVELTDQTLRRQPETLFDDTARKLDEIEKDVGNSKDSEPLNAISSARAQLNRLIREINCVGTSVLESSPRRRHRRNDP